MKFRSQALAQLWDDPLRCAPAWIPPDLRKPLYRKLQMLDAACTLNDLRVPPSNHPEKLKGDLRGRYSIRVNRQWRLCFQWNGEEAVEVEFVDYHG